MVWSDIVTISSLVLLEGLLSADNALVLALLVRHLPAAQRRRALRYGLLGAFGFRFLFLLVASWLITAWYCKVIGAAYLLYIGLKHIVGESQTEEARHMRPMGFWRTVVVVELTDVAFSIDSILAAVALSNKLWVVYLGGIAGIVTMRFVAGGFLQLLDRFPAFTTGAYVLVTWIGLKLLIGGAGMAAPVLGPHVGWGAEQIARYSVHMPEIVFWSGMAIIVISCLLWKRPPHTKHSAVKDTDSVRKAFD
ncbi:MAG: TerC family protein [Deltaproteobacteria bacterium]|nr:TerC family protein [Deltaproteobacteria bacterium]